MKAKAEVRLDFSSPGDAAIVKPLLPSHDDVESTTKIVRLHIHDLMKRSVKKKKKKKVTSKLLVIFSVRSNNCFSRQNILNDLESFDFKIHQIFKCIILFYAF